MGENAKIISLPREVLLVSHRKRGDEVVTKRTSLKEREKQRRIFLKNNETCAN